MTALWIICAIFLIFILFLLIPLDLLLTAGSEKKLQVYFRVLGITVRKKKSKKTKPETTPRKEKSHIINKVKKLLELPDSASTIVTLQEAMALMIEVLKRVTALIRKIRIKRCRILSISGGSDAAVYYGKVCAVVYPAAAFFKENFSVRERDLDLSITWDYGLDSSRYDAELILQIHVFQVAGAAIHILMDYLKQRNKNKQL